MTLQFLLILGLAGLAIGWLVRSVLQACRKEGCAACDCKGCPARKTTATVPVRRPGAPGCR